MDKRLVLVFCALFVLAACVPAFAAVQNIKVSGDILARVIARQNLDLIKGNGGTRNEDEIDVFNSVARLRVDAELTENVSAVVRLINERNWEEANATSTDIDLDLAYVTMKDFLCYAPLAIGIGRQELHFGNDMIIGDGVGSDPNGSVVNSGGIGTNQYTNYSEALGYADVAGLRTANGDLAYRKAFDAIRATLDYDPLVVDVVFAMIGEGNITGAETADDIYLYGINAGYKLDDKWNTSAEAYWWNKDMQTSGVAVGAGSDKVDRTTTLGARVSTNPTEKLNLQQEVAFQGGRKNNGSGIIRGTIRDRNAWASQSMVTVVPGWKHDPVFGMVYSYFSGDSDPASIGASADKDYYAWDPMFENQTAGRLINALFPQWNCHNVDIMMTLKPDFVEDVTLRLDWVYQALAKAQSNAGTSLANDYNSALVFNANKKEIGQEVDVTLTYDYTEDVQFGLCTDWFMPARAVKTTTDKSATANEVIASCKVEF